MKLGRNEPCHCGSGQKYKRCCLASDEKKRGEDEQNRTPIGKPAFKPDGAPQLANPQNEESVLEKEDLGEPLYRQFKSLTEFDAKLDFLFKAMRESAFDYDMALEMSETLFYEALKLGRARQFLEIADRLCEAKPETIAEGTHYFFHWRVSAALASGQFDRAAGRFLEFAAHSPAEGIDPFGWTVEKMAYYGQLRPLLEGLRRAWPDIEASEEVVPWAKGEYFNLLIECAIFDYLEALGPNHLAQASADDPELKSRIEPWREDINSDVLRSQVSLLRGDTIDECNIEDFRSAKSAKLLDLTWEFLAHLRWRHGIPFTRASMLRDRLHEYLTKRTKQELGQESSLWDQVNRPRRKPKRQKAPFHLLCPDRETLDAYLARQTKFFSPDCFAIATAAEAIPRWLSFLRERGLVSGETVSRAASELIPLYSEIKDLLTKSGEGSDLVRNLDEAFRVLESESETTDIRRQGDGVANRRLSDDQASGNQL